MREDNNNNKDFYNNIGVDIFQEMACKGGFETFKDLEIAYPYFHNAKSLVELGAGYGRCLEFLSQKKFTGSVYAIEYSENLATVLKEKYQSFATILQADIKILELPQKVDAALWMWSGFIDFTPEEQLHCIKLVCQILNENGKLLIDIPRFGVQTIASHQDLQNIKFTTPYGTLKSYIPTMEDMKAYQKKSDFKEIEKIDYETTTDKQRSLFIFSK